MPHVVGKVCPKHPDLGGLRLNTARGIGRCVECNKESQRRYYEANRERLRVEHREYARANREKNAARAMAWAKANRERHNRNARNWNAANKGRSRAFAARWAKGNPERAAALAAKYRAHKGRATPLWADRAAILEIYSEARRLTLETGVEHHVDHIIPINHPLVCGLHVPANLRVIPASENTRKGNRVSLTALSA